MNSEQPSSTKQETIIPSVVLPNTNPPVRQSAWVRGFVTFDRLYLKNGTFYVVTTDADFPPRTELIAQWLDLQGGVDSTATDKEMQYIHPEKASEVLGDYATVIPGFSVILYDPPQFMHHFYHWWGEIMIGMWRVYSTLAYGTTNGNSPPSVDPLPFPSRFLMPAVEGDQWRDRAGVIGPLMRAAFPAMLIEKADWWADLAKLGTTVVFERTVIISRYNAHNHPSFGIWHKMIAGTMSLVAPDGYWEPIRKSLVRNTIGYVPAIDSKGRILRSSMPASRSDELEPAHEKPVVTYISRQGAGRRLNEEDHVRLVESLRGLESEGLCRFEMPMMEKLTINGQLAVGARTTILVGVHGNGLTHQLIMPPSLRSTIFEIFDPPAYGFDYEMLARNLGHKHYAVNNDTLITFSKGQYHKGVLYTPGFHGNSIPVFGPVIADMIRRRLTEPDSSIED
ncbi:hypothetical protein FA15DRAFT_590707 [Coprinopsis marcescibilis]|uniref:Glycosyltransferase 61 catalytic domain-containing protein n=1 Tax=Coprinopsis marcescibilis TaxID=230819 RepID=A0A5C3KY46_COPMA|nr:hypothetical protein FA15DRAFT_590707 [Coprinopsis marcescibilis]